MIKKTFLFAGSDNTPSEAQEQAQGQESAKPETQTEAKPKPTDEVAQLLKEVMEKKQTITQQKAKIEELESLRASIESMGGVDTLAEIVKAHKAKEAEAMVANGEWDKLKTQMVEEHTKATENYRKEIQALQERLSNETHKIAELTVGSAFGSSQFLNQKTILSPAKARVIYGGYFETGENGEVVAYDKPKSAKNRTPLVDQYGNNLPFDLAIEKIIMSDPDKDSLLRVSGASGSGSKSDFKPLESKASVKEKSSLEKIAEGLKKLK